MEIVEMEEAGRHGWTDPGVARKIDVLAKVERDGCAEKLMEDEHQHGRAGGRGGMERDPPYPRVDANREVIKKVHAAESASERAFLRLPGRHSASPTPRKTRSRGKDEEVPVTARPTSCGPPRDIQQTRTKKTRPPRVRGPRHQSRNESGNEAYELIVVDRRDAADRSVTGAVRPCIGVTGEPVAQAERSLVRQLEIDSPLGEVETAAEEPIEAAGIKERTARNARRLLDLVSILGFPLGGANELGRTDTRRQPRRDIRLERPAQGRQNVDGRFCDFG